MSAILPPAERLWYKHPIDRVEGTWIAIALTWCFIMFFMMIGWHIWGKQNLSTETYRTTPPQFMAKTQGMVDKYTVRTETDEKTPVVKPPPGSDVFLIARLWRTTRPTGCTWLQWTSTTASRCSRPTSTSKWCPASSTWSRSRRTKPAPTQSCATNTAGSATTRWSAGFT
jgi:hypothetical protein